MSTRALKSTERIPPLEPGDHLTRAEFERRYDLTPGLKKAELIDGKVYMPPPVSHDNHSAPHFRIIGWLAAYSGATPGVIGGDNGSLRLDLDNMPQPDAYLLIDPARGGQARIDEDGYVAGAPELVAEVAATSASYDLHEKLTVYRRSGVREYIVWRVRDEALDWLVLRQGEYVPLQDEAGLFQSQALPGLWLDAAALLDADLAKVLQVVQRGCASPEHAAFVKKLADRSSATAC